MHKLARSDTIGLYGSQKEQIHRIQVQSDFSRKQRQSAVKTKTESALQQYNEQLEDHQMKMLKHLTSLQLWWNARRNIHRKTSGALLSKKMASTHANNKAPIRLQIFNTNYKQVQIPLILAEFEGGTSSDKWLTSHIKDLLYIGIQSNSRILKRTSNSSSVTL